MIDTSSYSDDGIYIVTLVIQLVNFPTTVARAYSEFQVYVLPILNSWVPPETQAEEEKKE